MSKTCVSYLSLMPLSVHDPQQNRLLGRGRLPPASHATAVNPPVFALVDCSNFYASCERVFRPDLTHRPIAVLSNNDGCVVASHASRAGEKLRSEGLKAGYLQVFITTKRFGPGPHHSVSLGVRLNGATSHTGQLIHAARSCLARCYRATTARSSAAVGSALRSDSRSGNSGHGPDWRTQRVSTEPYRYRKAGVILMDLRPAQPEQLHLFKPPQDQASSKARRLMHVIDQLNRKMGRGTVFMASCGTNQKRKTWTMKSTKRSPRYTTRWDEVPVVQAIKRVSDDRPQ